MAAGLGFKTFTTGEVLTAADTNGYLMQGVLVFASAAARDAAITSPQEGQCCYLKDTDAVLTYSGSAWVGFDDSNAIQNSIVDAKGDLVAASGADTPARLAAGNNGESIYADSAATTGLRYQGSIAGGKNVIINGGFDIWQRGTSFTSTGANIYSADRFAFQTQTSGTVTQDTTSLPNGFRYGWKFTSNASNTYMQSGTQIEFQNMENLQNNTVVISFWAKANNTNAGSTALTVRTRTSATTDAVVLFAGSNTDTSVTLTTSYVRYFVTRTFTTFGAVSLEFVLGANVSTDGFTIAGVQMELGSVATAFSKAGGTLPGELAACQRYLPAIGAINFSNGAFANSTTRTFAQWKFPVTARVAPTGITTPAASNFQVFNASTVSGNATAVTFDTAGTETADLYFDTTAGSPTLVLGNGGMVKVNTSGYILFTGCEFV